MKNIVDLMMKRVTRAAEGQGPGDRAHRRGQDAARAPQGYDQSLGARPLRRTIQRLVEDPLSEKLLWKEFRAGQTIIVDVRDGEIVFENAVDDPARRAARRARRLRPSIVPPDVPPVETRLLHPIGELERLLRFFAARSGPCAPGAKMIRDSANQGGRPFDGTEQDRRLLRGCPSMAARAHPPRRPWHREDHVVAPRIGSCT